MFYYTGRDVLANVSTLIFYKFCKVRSTFLSGVRTILYIKRKRWQSEKQKKEKFDLTPGYFLFHI